MAARSGDILFTMKTLLVLVVACGAAWGQMAGSNSADLPMSFPKPKAPPNRKTDDCKGKPDHVYAHEDGVYHACVDGKDVSSEDKTAIPRKLIEEYEAAQAPKPDAFAGKGAEDGTTVVRIKAADMAAATPPPRLPDERLKEIAVGMAAADVVQKLGDPAMKISGEVDDYAYVLVSGKTVELYFEKGKLARVKVVD